MTMAIITDPINITVLKQRHAMDCLICCLAMLTGASYEATLLAVSKVCPDSGTDGLHWTEAIAAGKLLGHSLRLKRHYDPYNSVGVVALTKKKQPNEHAAFLLRGVLIDPTEPSVWDDYEMYEQATGWKMGTLLTWRRKQ